MNAEDARCIAEGSRVAVCAVKEHGLEHAVAVLSSATREVLIASLRAGTLTPAKIEMIARKIGESALTNDEPSIGDQQ